MNQMLDQFAKLSIAVKVVILVVIVAVIGAVEYQVIYVPKQDKLKSLTKQANGLSVKYAENQAIADNLERFQEEHNILSEQLKQAVALLPNDAKVHDIYRHLSIVAKKTNIDLLSFKPGGRKGRGFYSEIGMNLKLNGTYHDIASFIDQVGKLSRIINISDIVFSGKKKARNAILLKVDCKATTFVFGGGGKGRKKGKRGGKKKRK